jgi:hypothetical protein
MVKPIDEQQLVKILGELGLMDTWEAGKPRGLESWEIFLFRTIPIDFSRILRLSLLSI